MGNRVVVIIDDEIGILNLLARFLKRKGFEVHTAMNLSEGDYHLRNVKPDYLFLDVNLPDGNGLDMLPKVKGDFPSLSIIMMSAFDHEDMRMQARSKGALAFLSKPFSLTEVDSIVH